MAKNSFVTMSLSGYKELARAFTQLPPALSKRVLTKTLSGALKETAARAKMLAPKDEGDLTKNIRVSTRLSKSQARRFGRAGDVNVYVGPSYPAAAHAHLTEFGTRPRYHKKTGKYVGVMPARPFMRPAWDITKARVLELISRDIWTVLRKEVARLRKRAESGKLSKSQLKHFRGF